MILRKPPCDWRFAEAMQIIQKNASGPEMKIIAKCRRRGLVFWDLGLGGLRVQRFRDSGLGV